MNVSLEHQGGLMSDRSPRIPDAGCSPHSQMRTSVNFYKKIERLYVNDFYRDISSISSLDRIIQLFFELLIYLFIVQKPTQRYSSIGLIYE
mgnify:CR=1 FL=1